MAFTKLSDDLDIVAKLDDEPNDVGGLSPDELKAVFDEAGNKIKKYINEVLTEELESRAGAENIGIVPIQDVDATTVQRALELINYRIAQAVAATIPDFSIKAIKLASNSITRDKIANGEIVRGKLAAASVIDDNVVSVSANKVTGKLTDEQLEVDSVGNEQMKNYSVDHYKMVAGAVYEENINNAAVTRDKVKNGEIVDGKLGTNSVNRDDIKAGAVTDYYTVDIPTGWSGSAAPYSQTVTVNGLVNGDHPIVSLNPSTTYSTAASQMNEWRYVYRFAVTADNTLTVYSSHKPAIALPIQMIVTRK